MRTQQVRRIHVFSFLLGVWMVLAPFALNYSHTAATVNGVIAGLLIAGFSFIRLRSPTDSWTSWALSGMGIWLVLSPVVVGYAHPATYWNELLFGIGLVVLIFSAVSSTIRHHSHLVH